MVYEQAPRQLLQPLTAVNQIPCYVATRNGALDLDSVPLKGAISLDSVVLRLRVYGCDPFYENGNPKLLYPTPERRKSPGLRTGSAVGFKLGSLLKLTETRAREKKITIMNYLCKVLADKLPEVLDFSKDLANLEPAAKIQLKFLAEEMQDIRKGLKKVEHERSTSENDGHISETFCKAMLYMENPMLTRQKRRCFDYLFW